MARQVHTRSLPPLLMASHSVSSMSSLLNLAGVSNHSKETEEDAAPRFFVWGGLGILGRARVSMGGGGAGLGMRLPFLNLIRGT